VYVTDTSPSTLNSAYTLLAKLKQLHKNSLYSAKIITSIDEMREMESVIVVGALNNIPPELLTEMKEFVPNQNWQTFGVATIPSANGVFGWIKNTYEYVFGRNTKNSPAIGQVGLASGLGNSIVMTQFYSDKFSMPMLVVTASDSARLENGVVKLVNSEVWAALSGSAMLWTEDGQVLATSQPTARRLIGGRVGLHISDVILNNIWSIAIGVLVLFLVAAGVLWKTLKSRAREIQSMLQK